MRSLSVLAVTLGLTLGLCSFSLAAQSPATRPGVVQKPIPVLVPLPGSIHDRLASAASERAALLQELTASAAAVKTDFARVFSSFAPFKTEDGRKSLAADGVNIIRTAAQIDLERRQYSATFTTLQANMLNPLALREGLQWYSVLLTTLGDTEGAKTLMQYADLGADAVSIPSDYLKADEAGQQKLLESLRARIAAAPTDVAAGDAAVLILRRKVSETPALAEALYQTLQANAANSIPAVKQFVLMAEHSKKLAAVADKVGAKEFPLTGTLVNGKPFNIADWKGRVVLIDFWATWCGPCKAELPRIKALYKQYHGQGLEILGVSNDYAREDLVKYIAADPDMPWPQLFDEAAASSRKWHPLTTGFGINGIPTMYLVDRKGVLRSVKARSELETLIPTLLAEVVVN